MVWLIRFQIRGVQSEPLEEQEGQRESQQYLLNKTYLQE